MAMSPDQPTHLHKAMCPGVRFFDELTRSLEESASVHTSVDVFHRSMESFLHFLVGPNGEINATHSDLSCFVSFSGTSHTYKDWREELRQWYFFLLQALPRRQTTSIFLVYREKRVLSSSRSAISFRLMPELHSSILSHTADMR